MTTLPYDHEAVDNAYRKWVDDRPKNNIQIELFDNWLKEEYGMTTIDNVYRKKPEYYRFRNTNDLLMFLLRWS